MDFLDNIIDHIRELKPGGNDAPVAWYGIPVNRRNALDTVGMEPPKEDGNEAEDVKGQPSPEPSLPAAPEDGSD